MNRNFQQQQQQQQRRNEMWAWRETKRKKKKRNKGKYPSAAAVEEEDEKADWLILIGRSFAFVIAILVGGVVLGGLGYFIGFLTMGDEGAIIGGMIGMVLALPFAIIVAANISR